MGEEDEVLLEQEDFTVKILEHTEILTTLHLHWATNIEFAIGPLPPPPLLPSNNNNVPVPNNANNNIHSYNENHTAVSSSSGTVNMALQYPHQQPHQVQQQHVIASVAGYSGALGGSAGSTTRLSDIGMMGRGQEAYKNNNPTSLFNHPSQQQPILGGGILSISGSTQSAAAAASMNPPMALVSGDDGSGGGSTTVLSLPPGAVTVNPRGGIDISWRNPYHVPGTSVSRCRAYSRDFPNSFGAGPSASLSRGTRGRRTSSSSSSGLGRNSNGTAAHASNHSQNATNETPEGMTDRSTRSEHTSFDRDTITPQRSLSLTSPETGGDQSSHVTSGRPSLENDPSWACTKRVGLTLCFLAFILLGTVGAKFMIQGPGVIDTSRTGKAEAAAYFLFTELIFVAFAMALFFTGVACLRKRTNDYLLRQFNQYILNTSATPGGAGGRWEGFQVKMLTTLNTMMGVILPLPWLLVLALPIGIHIIIIPIIILIMEDFTIIVINEVLVL
ncbi:Gamma-glutamyltransferase 5 [Orchesella cincta]|uniref:Gamma-glutamyltransferase 5 n=1 Tax=Orchesella cincta TaxID=48709 RepID=A0A1D2NGH0_ORCCI|nr:Gamma-glutamyltransferase 5 [Orchesella cincta]